MRLEIEIQGWLTYKLDVAVTQSWSPPKCVHQKGGGGLGVGPQRMRGTAVNRASQDQFSEGCVVVPGVASPVIF